MTNERHAHGLPRRRRYPSDTTDTEWEILAPLLPAPASTTPTGGHPEAHPRREIVDAIRYVVDNGCKWRAVPSDFPPWQTVYGFFARWAKNGVLDHVRDHTADHQPPLPQGMPTQKLHAGCHQPAND
ncbi:hypothetical protein Ait01nite_058910 [Actinoplanes italicus]|uniref:Putative transposase of IS4/5 family DUF4096 n=1 Tax=Actinoplanes italicus TaxID=113567 RepID=A0A2T0K6L1_9ACTN|nr:putative transposase of IS4/5 family DUF4096 [Actinoplanes italicus]GIE32846.1 hypothetical protein Ait01nite_058910 [Actinoplanes italicus]